MKYFGNWADINSVEADFFPESWRYKQPVDTGKWEREPNPEYPRDASFPTDDEVLIGSYEVPSYEGYAILVYERDGKLYEVNGFHCSCYGLEDQWSPEETTREALAMRKVDEGYYSHGADFAARYKELFGDKEAIERSVPPSVQEGELQGEAQKPGDIPDPKGSQEA